MLIALALPVIAAIVIALHVYLWWRLVAGPFRRRRTRLIGAALIVALGVCAPLGVRSPGWLPGPVATACGWIGALWIATLFYLLLSLLVLEFLRPLGRRWLRRRAHAAAPAGAAQNSDPADSPASASSAVPEEAEETEATRAAADLDRRAFLGKATALTAGLTALGTVGYGAVEARSVRVKHVPITLPTLDPRLDGFRIALLTDIHLSETLRRPFLERVVHTVNGLNVGAVAIVGDLMDGTVDQLGGDAEALTGLRPQHGTYFVTGNHEYYSGAAEWVKYLPTLGVKVLRNERLSLTANGASLELAGVDDVTAASSGVPGHGANLAKALDGRDPDQPVVLLAHQPVQWPEAVRRGVDLQLSGHTHGGQLWPFNYAVRLQQPVVAGHQTDGDSQIYVSRGVGYWGPPVRVGARPEISLIELHSA